jgi:hypothetical protein
MLLRARWYTCYTAVEQLTAFAALILCQCSGPVDQHRQRAHIFNVFLQQFLSVDCSATDDWKSISRLFTRQLIQGMPFPNDVLLFCLPQPTTSYSKVYVKSADIVLVP